MKIPTNAKRVFKGIIFDIYQWEQKMFDGNFKTFEMLKRPNTVEIIATRNNKILLSKQSQPNKEDFYSLFGGRQDEDEESLATAKRELLEESGMESQNWELIKTYSPLHKIDWDIYLFIAGNCEKVKDQDLDSGERIKVVEYTFDEFIEIVESDKYWGNELVLDILRMKQDGEKLNEFKSKIFRVC